MNVAMCVLALSASTGAQDGSVESLRAIVNDLREEVAQLKTQGDDAWLTDQRADEIRGLIHDVLADADTRVSLLGDGVTAGYNKGAFLASADGNWKLKINGHLQTRWLYNDADGQNSFHGFEQRRTKLKFSGHVIDPSWKFKITATWGRAGGSATEDAWIEKQFENGGWLKVGQFKAGFLRENIVSSSKQLGVERSMLNNAFTYGWSQGVSLGWKNDDVNLFAQYTDGPHRSNTAALSSPTNAWVLRGEMRFGDAGWKDFGSFTSKSGGKNSLLVGVAYENYNSDLGLFEYGNAMASESHGWTVDASFRGDGWNVFAYTVNTTGRDKTTGFDQDSSGWLLQGGFLVSDNVELFAKYQSGDIDNSIFTGASNSMSAFGVGFNYWPKAGSNNIKWTTDVNWAGDSIANGTATAGNGSADWVSSGNGWRSDTANRDGQMLIRTQLQLLF